MRNWPERRHGLGLGWLSIGMFIGTLMPRFGGENPLGSAPDGDNWHHEGLTRHAAQQAGWSREAENALAFHADYLDSYLYNPLWWFNVPEGGGLDRLKLVLSSQHELIKLHFDDLFSPEQVHDSWQRYRSGTVAGLLWIATSSFPREVKASMAHNVVGASLHAVQDFYSHSNWIDDTDRRDRTWFEVPTDERRQLPLWTGSYEKDEHLGHKPHGDFLFACTVINNLGGFGRSLLRLACHAASPLAGSNLCMALRACDEAEAIDVPEAWRDAVPDALESSLVFVQPGINVDSRWLAEIGAQERGVPGLDGATAFATAYDLAARTSVQWLECLEGLMAEAGFSAFWKDVKRFGVSDSAYLSDTVPWEDLALMPYRFLSAGPYPPARGSSDTQQWYLRLTIATADVDNAGTNADIVATVDGKRFPVLDHAPPPDQPEPGEPPVVGVMPSVLAHDDFERGSTAAYIVGPLEDRPHELVLHNDAPTGGDVVLAALEAVLDAIVGFFESVGNFFLSLVGYHADYVDSDHDVADAATLNGLGVGDKHTLDLNCDGRSEGHYRLDGYVEKTAVTGSTHGVPWREYRVAVTRLRCIEESDWDRGTSSDEPFVLGLFIPHGGLDETARWRTGPYSGVDSGDSRTVDRVRTLRVPERYGAITVAAAVYESDSETSGDRDELLAEFAGEIAGATEAPEQGFFVTLGEAIAADWRPAWIEAAAFRRGTTVELCRFPTVAVHRWVDGGDRLTVPLEDPACIELEVGETCEPRDEPRLRIDIPTLDLIDFDIPAVRRRPTAPVFDANPVPRPVGKIDVDVSRFLPEPSKDTKDTEDPRVREDLWRRKRDPRFPPV